jgi:hypothetical protein
LRERRGHITKVLDEAGAPDARVILRERDAESWTVEGLGADIVAKAIMDGSGEEARPIPPTLGPPRRSRDGPRQWLSTWIMPQGSSAKMVVAGSR